jgi:hypothetical protein
LSPERPWPVVVATIPVGRVEPFTDPGEIKTAVADLAEVVVMPTNNISRTFASEMPDLTQVYGGVGRVYPVDLGWITEPTRSKLRFAYSEKHRRRATDLLIGDALAAALDAGLVEPPTGPDVRECSGRVQRIIDSRAMVRLDDGSLATVWEELTIPGVPLRCLLVVGQRVTGCYDPGSRRLDIRGPLRFTGPAGALAAVLTAYDIGDVVLADVASVGDRALGLRLLPDLITEVTRDAITSNPSDRLTDLFRVGEVVTCRVASLDPLRLRLDDIDDEEKPRRALSLLPNGPPWLSLDEPVPGPAGPPAGGAATVVPRQAIPYWQLRPDPVGPAAPDATEADGEGQSEAERQAAHVARLSAELAAERAGRKALAAELEIMRDRAEHLEADLARVTRSRERYQSQYRDAHLARQNLRKQLRVVRGQNAQKPHSDEPVFLSPEEQFRYEVYREWAERIPAGDKAGRPLRDYRLAPGFLDSIEQVEGVSRAKVVAVVVEVVTDLVKDVDSRRLHTLRDGAGGPSLRRADGAICWRVALKRETPAAARLHYWRLGDTFEFSRAVVHDDYRP